MALWASCCCCCFLCVCTVFLSVVWHVTFPGHFRKLRLRVDYDGKPGPKVIKLFSCSTQLSTKFQVLIKLKYRRVKKFLALSLSDAVFILLINVKMPTIVGILTFMSRINFVLS